MMLPNYRRNGSWSCGTVFWDKERISECSTSRIQKKEKEDIIWSLLDIAYCDEKTISEVWDKWLKNTPESEKELLTNSYSGKETYTKRNDLSETNRTEDEHKFYLVKKGNYAYGAVDFVIDYHMEKKNYPLAEEVQRWFFHKDDKYGLNKDSVITELIRRLEAKHLEKWVK